MNRGTVLQQIDTIRMSRLAGSGDFARKDLLDLVKSIGFDPDLSAVKQQAAHLVLDDTEAQQEIAAAVEAIEAGSDHSYVAVLREIGQMMAEATAAWQANLERQREARRG